MNYILVDFFVSRLPSLVALPSGPHAEESRTAAFLSWIVFSIGLKDFDVVS